MNNNSVRSQKRRSRRREPISKYARAFVTDLRRFRGTMPSDSDEDVKRVVRSAKDKRYHDLKEVIRSSRNVKKIKDMSRLLMCGCARMQAVHSCSVRRPRQGVHQSATGHRERGRHDAALLPSLCVRIERFY
jgi:hypothetical protein